MNFMNEVHSLMQLLGMLACDTLIAPMCALLVLAAAIDVRTNRIPNWLCSSGIVYAVLYAVLISVPTWYAGPVNAVGGLLVGGLVMLPLYALAVLGAGDVKLSAMVGTFLGPTLTGQAVILVFIIGGAAALIFSMRNRVMLRMLRNVGSIARTAVLTAGAGGIPALGIAKGVSVGRLPYGVSIAVGTILFVVLHQIGYL